MLLEETVFVLRWESNNIGCQMKLFGAVSSNKIISQAANQLRSFCSGRLRYFLPPPPGAGRNEENQTKAAAKFIHFLVRISVPSRKCNMQAPHVEHHILGRPR